MHPGELRPTMRKAPSMHTNPSSCSERRCPPALDGLRRQGRRQHQSTCKKRGVKTSVSTGLEHWGVPLRATPSGDHALLVQHDAPQRRRADPEGVADVPKRDVEARRLARHEFQTRPTQS